MILIAIGLVCLLELKKEELDKSRKIIVLKSFLIMFYSVVLKQKKTCFKNIYFKTSSHFYTEHREEIKQILKLGYKFTNNRKAL